MVVVFLVMITVGVLAPASAMRKIMAKNRKKRTYTKSEGTVVQRVARFGGVCGGHVYTLYMPVFEYFVDGQQYLFSGYKRNDQTYTNVGVPAVGAKRTIWINPDDPTDVFTREPASMQAMFFVIGACMLFFGIGGLFALFGVI